MNACVQKKFGIWVLYEENCLLEWLDLYDIAHNTIIIKS